MNYLQKKKLAFMSIVNKVKGFVRTVFGVPPITLPDCVDNDSIINYTIEGNSVQDGTPTPETPIEVESVGEKTRNLWYPSTDISWNSGITGVLNSDNTFTLSGTATKQAIIHLGKVSVERDVLYYITGGVSPDVKLTFQLRKEDNSGITSVSVGNGYNSFRHQECSIVNAVIVVSEGVNVDNIVIKPMISLENTTEYEPYGYKIPVVCSGKNLLNPKWLKRGAIPDSTGKPQSSTTRVYTDLISFEAGEYYMRISNYNNLSLRLRGMHTYNYDTEEWEGYSNWSNVMGKFFTISTRCKARFVFQTSSGDIITVEDVVNGNPMITLKNAGTAYEPYVEPITTNIFLDEPLAEGETLKNPVKLPTIKGTTIYSIDTAIQPSNMSATYYSTAKE